MGNAHKQEMKRLLGHSDFGPVLGDDVLVATASLGVGVQAHAVEGAWEMPRAAQIKGIIAMSDAAIPSGTIEYAVTYDGVVALSGSLDATSRSAASFVPLTRQSAVIVDSGTLVEIVSASASDMGGGLNVRLSVPVSYIGNL